MLLILTGWNGGVINREEAGECNRDNATTEFFSMGKRGGGCKSPQCRIVPRHEPVFTHSWCRHLFAQHPPLLQANVTQPTVQNAPAELLNNVERATAGDTLSGRMEG